MTPIQLLVVKNLPLPLLVQSRIIGKYVNSQYCWNGIEGRLFAEFEQSYSPLSSVIINSFIMCKTKSFLQCLLL